LAPEILQMLQIFVMNSILLTQGAVSGIRDLRKAVNFSKVTNAVDRTRTCSSTRQSSVEISKNIGYQRWGSPVWKYPGTSTIDYAATLQV
jgi:hypothetical protein